MEKSINLNYQSQTKRVIDYIANEYGVEPEFLWPKQSPNHCIFRNMYNKKWFGIIMVVPGAKIGLDTNKNIDIIDLKFDDGQALDFAYDNKDIFPGYHMNKNNWITLVLDGRLIDEAIFNLIDNSFMVVNKNIKKSGDNYEN